MGGGTWWVIALSACAGCVGEFSVPVDAMGAANEAEPGAAPARPAPPTPMDRVAIGGPGAASFADASMVPHGNQIGDLFPAIAPPGYRLSPSQSDPVQAGWSQSIPIDSIGRNPACHCVVVSFGGSWCDACKREQPALIADVRADPSFCPYEVIQDGTRPGADATRADVDRWAQAYHPVYPVVQGGAAMRALTAGYGPGLGYPFLLVLRPPSMEVVAHYEGERADLHDWAVEHCNQ